MLRNFFYLVLVLPLLLTGCHTNTTIANNVPEREANEIVVLLASRGIAVEKTPTPAATTGGAAPKEQTWDISVPASQITDAIAVLNQAGLPRLKGTSLLDLFGSQGLVPSDLQDRIRYQEGLSEQLANTIRKMDGVMDADVQITLPSADEPNKTLTASVYVKHRGVLDNPNSIIVTKIKRLVSSSLPGLTIDNVTVILDRALYADITYPPNKDGGCAGKEYASIWGVHVSRDSLGLFRAIFYSFIILLFIFLALLMWMFWKFYPVLEAEGGFKALLNQKQILPRKGVSVPENENTTGEGEL
jgi:type III secretion protein J